MSPDFLCSIDQGHLLQKIDWIVFMSLLALNKQAIIIHFNWQKEQSLGQQKDFMIFFITLFHYTGKQCWLLAFTESFVFSKHLIINYFILFPSQMGYVDQHGRVTEGKYHEAVKDQKHEKLVEVLRENKVPGFPIIEGEKEKREENTSQVLTEKHWFYFFLIFDQFRGQWWKKKSKVHLSSISRKVTIINQQLGQGVGPLTVCSDASNY